MAVVAIGPVLMMIIVSVIVAVVVPTTGTMLVFVLLRIDQHCGHRPLDCDRGFARRIPRFDRQAHDF